MKEIEKMLEVYEQTKSIRKTAKIMKCSKNTIKAWIRKLVNQPDIPLVKIVKRKKVTMNHRSIPSSIEERIIRMLKADKEKHKVLRIKNSKILSVLRKDGIVISKSSVQRIVSAWRKANEPKKEIFIQQEPTKGPACEFDWGYIPLIIQGIALRIPAVFIVLRGSLYRFARIYLRETSQFVLQAHIDFFNQIGGVPDIIRYDNLKTVISNPILGTVNPTFLRFASHYGFSVSACNRGSPEEKGTDEESVGFLRNWVFSLRNTFSSIEEANAYFEENLLELNSKSVYRRVLTPMDGLKSNIDRLHPLPSLSYDNCLQDIRHINQYNQISVEANWYSVPDEYRYPTIHIRLYTDRLELWDERTEKKIAVHQRLFEKGRFSINIFHYLDTLHQKSGALKGSVALQQAHTILQRLFEKYYQSKPKEFIEMLYLIREQDSLSRIAILKNILSQGLVPTRELLINVIRQSPDPVPACFHYDTIPLQVPSPDFHLYDQLISGGKDG